MNHKILLTDPTKIAEAAENLYKEQFQQEFEKGHKGKFAAIDVIGKNAYVGEFPEIALQEARKRAPNGVFHLIRIGSPAAVKVNYVGKQEASWHWSLRPTG